MRAALNALLLSAVLPFAAMAGSPAEAMADPAMQAAAEKCERLDADRQAAGDQVMDMLAKDLRQRSDADSLATLAIISRVSAFRASNRTLTPAQQDKLVEAAAEGGRAAFAALWPRRDALAWSQLYPLFEHHRRHLADADRQRWEAYLIQRGGRSMHAFALRIRALEESDPDEEEMNALLTEAARDAVPGEAIFYDTIRRMVPALLRIPLPAAARTIGEYCGQVGEGQDIREVSEEAFAVLTAAGFAMALIPVGGYPTAHCDGHVAVLEPARADACRRLARRLALEGRTLSSRGIASAYWQRLARGAAEQAEALAARRLVRWWTEEGVQHLGHDISEPRHWATQMETSARIILQPGSNELDAVRAALREHGLGEAPPEAWMPANPESLQP
jgi:hypothetical protein